MTEQVVTGTALYFRGISSTYTPPQLVEHCQKLGLSWAAVGSVWQQIDEKTGHLRTSLMNSAEKCRTYLDALASAGIAPYVWGYPWDGGTDDFVRLMDESSGDHKNFLLDPEVGMTPKMNRATQADLARSRAMASKIVSELRARHAKRIGLSTYGVVPHWFPLDAFLRAGLDFAGGQTYTDDATVDKSIAQFLHAFSEAGVDIQLVPNFGCYKWVVVSGERKAYAKTGPEQDHHLMEFIDEGEPVHAVIGWADNFVRFDPLGKPSNGASIARFGRLMGRGACSLPRAA